MCSRLETDRDNMMADASAMRKQIAQLSDTVKYVSACGDRLKLTAACLLRSITITQLFIIVGFLCFHTELCRSKWPRPTRIRHSSNKRTRCRRSDTWCVAPLAMHCIFPAHTNVTYIRCPGSASPVLVIAREGTVKLFFTLAMIALVVADKCNLFRHEAVFCRASSHCAGSAIPSGKMCLSASAE